MPANRSRQVYQNGQLVDTLIDAIPDEQVRLETAANGLRGVRPLLRNGLKQNSDDQDALAAATTLAAMRPIIARMLGREERVLQALRRLLLALGLDADDGQD